VYLASDRWLSTLTDQEPRAHTIIAFIDEVLRLGALLADLHANAATGLAEVATEMRDYGDLMLHRDYAAFAQYVLDATRAREETTR